MLISATELKSNIGQYLAISSKEDVFITKNGKIVAKLSNPALDKQGILDSLVGIASKEPLDLKEIKEKRLSKQ